MSGLRVSVYVAKPVVSGLPDREGKPQLWSPISCTLIYTDTEAVLVDTPLTIKQTEDLVQWIKETAPDRKLSYVFITHGHGDHFFGIPILTKHFPGVVPVASAGTAKRMKEQVSDLVFNAVWKPRFGDQIAQPFELAEALPDNEFRLSNGSLFSVIECGHSDCADSTILWVPEIRLAVCGDVVYGWVHQMLLEANTAAKREEWIKAIDTIEALQPVYVVAGHKRPEEMDGVWHLAATRKYIQDFGQVVDQGVQSPDELFAEMKKRYPTRLNDAPLRLSCMGAFAGHK